MPRFDYRVRLLPGQQTDHVSIIAQRCGTDEFGNISLDCFGYIGDAESANLLAMKTVEERNPHLINIVCQTHAFSLLVKVRMQLTLACVHCLPNLAAICLKQDRAEGDRSFSRLAPARPYSRLSAVPGSGHDWARHCKGVHGTLRHSPSAQMVCCNAASLVQH